MKAPVSPSVSQFPQEGQEVRDRAAIDPGEPDELHDVHPAFPSLRFGDKMVRSAKSARRRALRKAGRFPGRSEPVTKRPVVSSPSRSRGAAWGDPRTVLHATDVAGSSTCLQTRDKPLRHGRSLLGAPRLQLEAPMQDRDDAATCPVGRASDSPITFPETRGVTWHRCGCPGFILYVLRGCSGRVLMRLDVSEELADDWFVETLWTQLDEWCTGPITSGVPCRCAGAPDPAAPALQQALKLLP